MIHDSDRPTYDQRYLAQRIYPTRPDALDVELFNLSGPTFVRYLQAWDMAPANRW